MVHFSVLLLAALSVSRVTASPSSNERRAAKMHVAALRSRDLTHPDGTVDHARFKQALQARGRSQRPHPRRSSADASDGSPALDPELSQKATELAWLHSIEKRAAPVAVKFPLKVNNAEWSLGVGYGTPPQPFELSLATYQTDTIFTVKGGPSKLVTYNPAKSSTSKKGISWKGEVFSGFLYEDIISFAGHSVPLIVNGITNSTDGSLIEGDAGTHYPQGFLGIGLANPDSKPKDTPTIMDVLIARKLIKEPAFTVNLAENTFHLGEVPTDVKFVWHKAWGNGHWAVDGGALTVNNKNVLNSPNGVVFDTMSHFTLYDTDTVDAIVAAIPGSSFSEKSSVIEVLCDTVKQYTVSIRIGSQIISTPLDTLVIGPTSKGSRHCLTTIAKTDIEPIQEPAVVIGAPWMRAFIVAFHYSYNGTLAMGISQSPHALSRMNYWNNGYW